MHAVYVDVTSHRLHRMSITHTVGYEVSKATAGVAVASEAACIHICKSSVPSGFQVIIIYGL